MSIVSHPKVSSVGSTVHVSALELAQHYKVEFRLVLPMLLFCVLFQSVTAMAILKVATLIWQCIFLTMASVVVSVKIASIIQWDNIVTSASFSSTRIPREPFMTFMHVSVSVKIFYLIVQSRADARLIQVPYAGPEVLKTYCKASPKSQLGWCKNMHQLAEAASNFDTTWTR